MYIAWIKFWRNVLTKSGGTEIVMTPRWMVSRGAEDEHRTARQIGIDISFLDEAELPPKNFV